MFSRVLIANRGEIAVRVIRACRELGISPIVVHSEADRDCLHVKLADRAVCIGPPAAQQSYLNMASILSAALISGAEAIHPGYGFLAENATFAEACRAHKLVFVGPAPEAITAMGDKAQAKEVARKAGVPLIPDSRGLVSTAEQALAAAKRLGYPVMIKAAAGGGGKGMRLVGERSELPKAVATARSEAQAAFGNDAVYLEKYIASARHVEVQVLADGHGNLVYLGERDCTTQRRHQKLVEEAPCPAVNARLRREIGEAAVALARAVGYVNAGTVEFLLDDRGRFYFMEMNTRIQVEHPVTEMVTGFDLVKAQLRIAAGQKLGLKQSDVVIRGHAIECRISAEDPEADWRPRSGRIVGFLAPGGPGVRWDSHLYQGYQVPPHYDSLLAKLIVHADTRKAAVGKMAAALGECRIQGVTTTLAWHRQLFANGFAPSPLAQNVERSRPAERVSGVAPDGLSLPEGAPV